MRNRIAQMMKVAGAGGESAFVFEVVTAGADTFRPPIYNGGTYDFYMDPGDGTAVVHITAWDDAAATINYAGAGTYEVKITGTITGWRFASAGDRTLIHDVKSWGPLLLGNLNGYFWGCTNLTVSATDILDITGMTTFHLFFRDCPALTGVPGIADWDTSNILSIGYMFYNCILFNSALTNWDTSSVVGTGFAGTLGGCTVFNQPLNHFDVSGATDFQYMFINCAAFNQPLNSWDVSGVANFFSCFSGCAIFNGNITSWTTTAATSFSHMFNYCKAFNQDISGFDLNGVTTIYTMFASCWVFNQDISGWNTSTVQDFRDAFNGAKVFNQDISIWDAGVVTNMYNMFNGALAFDQDLTDWDITAVTAPFSMDFMFKSSGMSVANYSATLIGWEAQAEPTGLTLGAGVIKYNIGAAAARAQLVLAIGGGGSGWTITDGGPV